MRNIYEMIEDSRPNLCEAFKDRRIYQAWKDINASKTGTWDDVFYGVASLQWDKITSDQIEEIDHNQIYNFIEQSRKIKKGKDRQVIAFCFYDEELKYIFIPDQTMLYGVHIGAWYSPSRSRPYKMNVTSIYDKVVHSDYLLVVYADVNTADQLKLDRSKSKEGMLPDLTAADHTSIHTSRGVVGQKAGGLNDDPRVWQDSYYKHCLKLSLEAEKRRKKIVANSKRNIQSHSGDDKVDAAAENATKLFSKLSDIAIKDPSRIERSQYDLIEYRIDTLLDQYDQFCSLDDEIKNNNHASSYKHKLRDNKAQDIVSLYDDVVKLCAPYGIKL